MIGGVQKRDLKSRHIDYNHYIVCGDFNINLLQCDIYVDATGSTLVNRNLPNRFSSFSNSSLLDRPFVSDIRLLLLLSYHINIIYLGSEYRDYKSVRVDQLIYSISYSNLQHYWLETTVDRKLDFLVTCLNELFDSQVPVLKITTKIVSCPWYNDNIKLCIRRRNRFHN